MTKTSSEKHITFPVCETGQGWLAVEKPSDISVHNEPGADLCSMLTRHIGADPSLAGRLTYNSDFGINPVHRLDKQTSGIILLACTPESFRHFSEQFESRTVKKRYVAILHGKVAISRNQDGWGLWKWPLSKNAAGRGNPAGSGKKVPCQTRFRVLRHTYHYTLVECELLTGRKHQIRRHAKLAGHPVVGDARYGTLRSVSYLKTRCSFDRLGLHAISLTVQPPGQDTPRTIRSPGIPPEMQHLMENDPAES